MEKLLTKLKQDFPTVAFVPGSTAHWSPSQQQITYCIENNIASMWSLLHELGHALLGHDTFASDMALLCKEVDAWRKAEEIAPQYGVVIDEQHIQNCLDTYRDWLHKRSTCPACKRHGLQHSEALYRCLNCQTTWQVTSNRFCRPYRLKKVLAA